MDRISIRNRIIENLKNDLSKIEGSYNYDIASAVGIELEETHKILDEMYSQVFPWSVSEDEALEKHLLEFGLERKKATPATGTVAFTGVEGSEIQAGTVISTNQGVKYKTLNYAVITETRETETEIECLSTGSIGNCGVGDIYILEISIAGIYSVTNKKQIDNGYEIEPFNEAILRMEKKAKEPAFSGNTYDYTQWCNSVVGVGKVKIFPLQNGAGTVGVRIANHLKQPASSGLVQNVIRKIDENKPIGATVDVRSFSALNVTIQLECSIKSGSFTKETLSSEIKSRLSKELLNDSFTENNILSSSKIGRTILLIPNVIDYEKMSVNGQVHNITIAEIQVPIILSVEVVKLNEY